MIYKHTCSQNNHAHTIINKLIKAYWVTKQNEQTRMGEWSTHACEFVRERMELMSKSHVSLARHIIWGSWHPHPRPHANRRLAACASVFIRFNFHYGIFGCKLDDCLECSAKGLLLTAIVPVCMLPGPERMLTFSRTYNSQRSYKLVPYQAHALPLFLKNAVKYSL